MLSNKYALQYAMSEEQAAIKKALLDKLASEKDKAVGHVTKMIRTHESLAHERLVAAGFKSSQALSVNIEACQALCDNAHMVRRTQ